MCRTGSVLHGLDGDVGFVRAALPVAPILLDKGLGLLRSDVAGDDDRRVFGPVVTVEELRGCTQTARACPGCLQEAHGGVLVGVRREGRVAQDFVQLRGRGGAVLVVLAEDGERLRS